MKGQPGKAPARQFYFRDWLSDGELQMASAGTRGIWMNILCTMMDESVSQRNAGKDGLIKTNLAGIMRLGGCAVEEAELFIEEARLFGFCEIKEDTPGRFHIMSRRLNREGSQRAKWRDIKRKQREKERTLGDVQQVSNETPPTSSTSSSISTSKKGNFNEKKLEPDIAISSKLAAQRLAKYKAKMAAKPPEERKWGQK